ncbi:MAG: hypothetical protein MUF14_02935 [Hyphomonadaceae bacterium]|nr:hypothetical protein [Hyphomonadaceae bacterium]
MTNARMVLTVAAPDRRGLVGMIAGIIRSHGGSWVDSAITRLAGALAGVIQIDIADDRRDGLLLALANLDTAQIRPVVADGGERRVEVKGRRARLVLACVDRPGIVADLATALAATGAVFETLETAAEHGSMSGEMMFSARAVVWMPDGLSPQALGDACEALSGDLMADIEMLPERTRPVVPA